MKSWIVRFASLYVFNVVVLLVIGLLTPAHVGWAVIWAALVMALAELVVRPLVTKAFQSAAARSAGERTKTGEWLVQAVIVLLVAAIVWLITVLLSGVDLGGSWFWAFVLPPVIITIGWFVYARVSGRLEKTAGDLYDRADASLSARSGADAAATTPAAAAGRQELNDGLTPEQRKMLDDLGKS
ncbi:hypothetical protein [Microbacterium aurum]